MTIDNVSVLYLNYQFMQNGVLQKNIELLLS